MGYYVRDGGEWTYNDDEPPFDLILDPAEQSFAERAAGITDYLGTLTPLAAAAASDNRFVVRIFKRWLANPLKTFSNVYELRTSITGMIPLVVPVLWDLLSYEKAFHLTAIEFFKATVSTWKPDGAPYNPNTFAVFNFDETGDRPVTGSAPEPGEATLYVNKNTSLGHAGKLWYRGCLLESDKQAPAGEAVEEGSGMQSTWQTAFTNNIAQYLGNGFGGVSLALVSGDGTDVRPVVSMDPTAIKYRQTGSIYFDKA